MSTQELIFLNYLSKVFDNLDDAIMLCELREGVIEPVMVNKVFYSMGGYTKADDLCEIGEDIARQKPIAAFLQQSYDALRINKKTEEAVIALTSPNGVLQLRTKIIPVLNSLGEPTHIVFIARDITQELAKDQLIAEQKVQLSKHKKGS